MSYRFGRFTLDPARFELRCDGEPRPVEPQVFNLLVYLIRHRDRVVTHDELVDSVWKGRVISEAALSSRISLARSAVGDSGKTQTVIRTVPRRGFRFVAPVEDLDNGAAGAVATSSEAQVQRVRFCRSADGTRIAYACSGAGEPVVKAGHWLTHLELDWSSPLWQPLLLELGRHAQIVRYDQRGNGLSDWEVEDFSLGSFVSDLEAVVNAAGLDRFTLYGTSQGAPIAVAYAVHHPERVRRLILQGGFVQGRLCRASAAEREQGEAYLTLMRHGWGQEGSPFLQAFSALFVPDGTAAQIQSFAELQRSTTSAENAVRLRRAVDLIDVGELLPQLRVPTLVIHSRNDGIQPLEQGRLLASGIPDAEFRVLESRNHVIVPQEPAWPLLIQALLEALGPP